MANECGKFYEITKDKNSGSVVIDDDDKSIAIMIFGKPVSSKAPIKKIGENCYEQTYDDGRKLKFSYSKDGKDLIVEYEFNAQQESGKETKEKEKKPIVQLDEYEVFLYRTGKIICENVMYNTGEIYAGDKSWKIYEKIITSFGSKAVGIKDGEYSVKTGNNYINCNKTDGNEYFQIKCGTRTSAMNMNEMIAGDGLKELIRGRGEYLIEGGERIAYAIVNEIKSAAKGKPVKMVVLTGDKNFEEKLCYPVDCGFRNGEPADSYWIKTLAGAFGSGRDKGRKHAGIDFYAPIGTPVYAIADGIVLTVNHFYEGAYSVVIEHSEIELNGKNIARQIRYGEMLGVDKTGILYGKNNDRTFDYIKGSQKGDLTAQIRKCIESIKMINITPGMKVKKGDIIGYVGVLDSPGLLQKVERELSEINNLGNYYKSIGGSMLHLEMYAGDKDIKNKAHSDVGNKEYKYVTVENYQRRKDLIDPTMFFGIKKDDIVKNFEIKQDKKIIIYEEKKGAKKKIYIGKNCKEIPERYIKFE